ncbi:MAG: FAD-dependent oxidoreductase, partial [Clostridia bacterium]|nr:FAD-dependent oxidoreductase [Clostridia bacterium]
MTDVLIVGAGPAGLTAAIYARRAATSVLVLEGRNYGGQIINTPDIENYPAAAHISGFDLATRMYEQATALGAEFVFEAAIGLETAGEIKTVVTANGRYEAKAVILATGSENRRLGLENEEALIGRGVSYCATCDGAFFRGKSVAVVGGGNTALEDALYLADLADTVYLIHRRAAFRGDEGTVNRLREKANVRLVYNSTVTALHADKRLQAIDVTDRDGVTTTLDVNGLFIAVGRVPENQPFGGVIALD